MISRLILNLRSENYRNPRGSSAESQWRRAEKTASIQFARHGESSKEDELSWRVATVLSDETPRSSRNSRTRFSSFMGVLDSSLENEDFDSDSDDGYHGDLDDSPISEKSAGYLEACHSPDCSTLIMMYSECTSSKSQ